MKLGTNARRYRLVAVEAYERARLVHRKLALTVEPLAQRLTLGDVAEVRLT